MVHAPRLALLQAPLALHRGRTLFARAQQLAGDVLRSDLRPRAVGLGGPARQLLRTQRRRPRARVPRLLRAADAVGRPAARRPAAEPRLRRSCAAVPRRLGSAHRRTTSTAASKSCRRPCPSTSRAIAAGVRATCSTCASCVAEGLQADEPHAHAARRRAITWPDRAGCIRALAPRWRQAGRRCSPRRRRRARRRDRVWLLGPSVFGVIATWPTRGRRLRRPRAPAPQRGRRDAVRGLLGPLLMVHHTRGVFSILAGSAVRWGAPPQSAQRGGERSSAPSCRRPCSASGSQPGPCSRRRTRAVAGAAVHAVDSGRAAGAAREQQAARAARRALRPVHRAERVQPGRPRAARRASCARSRWATKRRASATSCSTRCCSRRTSRGSATPRPAHAPGRRAREDSPACANARVRAGPAALQQEEREALSGDAESMRFLHREAWRCWPVESWQLGRDRRSFPSKERLTANAAPRTGAGSTLGTGGSGRPWASWPYSPRACSPGSCSRSTGWCAAEPGAGRMGRHRRAARAAARPRAPARRRGQRLCGPRTVAADSRDHAARGGGRRSGARPGWARWRPRSSRRSDASSRCRGGLPRPAGERDLHPASARPRRGRGAAAIRAALLQRRRARLQRRRSACP